MKIEYTNEQYKIIGKNASSYVFAIRIFAIYLLVFFCRYNGDVVEYCMFIYVAINKRAAFFGCALAHTFFNDRRRMKGR